MQLVKYHGENYYLLRFPGEWRLYKPAVSISYYNDMSVQDFENFLKEKEKEVIE